jgi:hypothetical protein
MKDKSSYRTDIQKLYAKMPYNIRSLPVYRGYPVPWFVYFDKKGVPDFRVLKPNAAVTALKKRTCWICGRAMIGRYAYLVGPMCAVNRISAEPPSHTACAQFSAIACPFLARPHAHRREVTDKVTGEVPGMMIKRNPGVGLVWVTSGAIGVVKVENGYLFDIGTPIATYWYAEGRKASWEEILESISSGLPTLRTEAAKDGAEAEQELDKMIDRAMKTIKEKYAA